MWVGGPDKSVVDVMAAQSAEVNDLPPDQLLDLWLLDLAIADLVREVAKLKT